MYLSESFHLDWIVYMKKALIEIGKPKWQNQIIGEYEIHVFKNNS